MISTRQINKYMAIARTVAEVETPCYSRKIGAVIVDGNSNKILSIGYNGPPRGIPHPDTDTFLSEYVWPQLTAEEKKELFVNYVEKLDDEFRKKFTQMYCYSGSCPRRILSYSKGKRSELCLCVHAETNAIINASRDLHGSVMFCWCGVPCIDCTKHIINAGISKVYCLIKDEDYSAMSRWLLNKAGVECIELNENTLNI